MDKLLARIAEAGDEEDVVIRFIDAAWSGTSLQLRIAVTILGSAQEIWEIRCADVLAYLLNNETANWLELTEDHSLLWEFKQESASAYFYQAPVNADAAVGALYQASSECRWLLDKLWTVPKQSTRSLQLAGSGKRFAGTRPEASSDSLSGDTTFPRCGGRYSLRASTAGLGWNSLATVRPGQHEGPTAGQFIRDWQYMGCRTDRLMHLTSNDADP